VGRAAAGRVRRRVLVGHPGQHVRRESGHLADQAAGARHRVQEPHARDVGVRVPPMPALAARGSDRPVPPLPHPEQVLRHAGACDDHGDGMPDGERGG
jgi:hypothetical protein